MNEFFKNNPLALRHCLLYMFLQEKSIDQTYEILCTIAGEEIIRKEELEIRFNQFRRGSFERKDTNLRADLRNVLRSDKYALRTCILYESLECRQLQKIKIEKRFSPCCFFPKYSMYDWECLGIDLMKCRDFDSWFFEYADYKIGHKEVYMKYRKFCKTIRDSSMEYREFEFWFYRFLNGEHDLNFERDKDRKVYELMDMPIDILENIVEYLGIVDRFALASTCQSLQKFHKDQKLVQSHLKFRIEFRDPTTISFGKPDYITYTSLSKNSCMKQITRSGRVFPGKYAHGNRMIIGTSSRKQAFMDFKSVLKHPKLRLNTLNLYINTNKSIEEYIDDWEAEIKIHSLYTKKLQIDYSDSEEPLLKILQFLKPGFLEVIELDLSGEIDKVVESEHWKLAKCFFMEMREFKLPLYHLYHFQQFYVRLGELSVENIREIKEVLLKSTDFENCTIEVYDSLDMDMIRHEFRDAIRENIFHYPLPNSNEYFEIKTTEYFDFEHLKIEFTRKKK